MRCPPLRVTTPAPPGGFSQGLAPPAGRGYVVPIRSFRSALSGSGRICSPASRRRGHAGPGPLQSERRYRRAPSAGRGQRVARQRSRQFRFAVLKPVRGRCGRNTEKRCRKQRAFCSRRSRRRALCRGGGWSIACIDESSRHPEMVGAGRARWPKFERPVLTPGEGFRSPDEMMMAGPCAAGRAWPFRPASTDTSVVFRFAFRARPRSRQNWIAASCHCRGQAGAVCANGFAQHHVVDSTASRGDQPAFELGCWQAGASGEVGHHRAGPFIGRSFGRSDG